MTGFRYLRPASLAQALAALQREGEGGRPVAGGTDLLVAVRHGKAAPRAVVDVTRVPELRELRKDEDGTLVLGAAITHAEAAESSLVRRLAPVLAQACAAVGSVQIRNLGTLGGNAVNASVAADTLPALAVLRARFQVAGPGGERRVALEDFFRGPGATCLAPGELVTAIRIPLEPPHGAAFLKVGRRRAAAISRLSVAVMANPESGLARIALGAVFPRPRRLTGAEEVLHRGFSGSLLEEAGAAAEAAVREVSGDRPSMAYKLPVARACVTRALRQALEAFAAGRGKVPA